MGYESLFTPFKIGNMEVKNRIGLSPMGTNSAFTNGRKDAQEIDYFIEKGRAKRQEDSMGSRTFKCTGNGYKIFRDCF